MEFGANAVVFGAYTVVFGANTVVTWGANAGVLGELDGVGPVDNRPSTEKFHPFVQ